ncbi:hypothetical protein BAY61_14005 [Prauserella marina]|uniref:non-specific serine/threonine protein kinase n=1 Tax=Prauserella marina TaxID=530584 RepID=A0A222VPU1_9PSEU|nr:serine/threonine protein kinase [Prauserella marina]ASR35935.1 hypothetical protein BAY61_14005 [Prauserella marina]PWV84137.1 serine/threonine-protein kinase PknG [Prauserella marina]SDC29528.1 serine/threonine-protein kinase PknG [Prauserella marina]
MPRHPTRPNTTTLAPDRFASREATTEELGGDLLGFPRLPRYDTAGAQLPFVEVPSPSGLVEGAPADPEPALAPGTVLAGKYEVIGGLAHGGLGWVYLAKDIELDELYVALKGMIDPSDTKLAEAERKTLTALNHPNIVRIFGFVLHRASAEREPDGYIVMEFVNGHSLRELLGRLGAGEDVFGEPLLAEHVIGYAQELLDALHYLHGQGLLYCDLKPDNIMHGGHRIKLIDLGATRKVGDDTTPLAMTRRYQVGDSELAQHGVTVRSDLHTLGVTLGELLAVSDDDPAGETAFGVRSLRHVIDRATAPFAQRFVSAADMAGALDGVLREIQSLRDGEPRPVPSALFAETPALFDVGLGAAPPLERWTAAPAEDYSPPPLDDGRPSPADIALMLPPPLPDPADAGAGFLTEMRAPDARRRLGQLAGWVENNGHTVELSLAQCRAHLEVGAPERARSWLDYATTTLGEDGEYDWRLGWHRGLLALTRSDILEAEAEFFSVHRALAGEAAPKLALGYCAEHQGKPDVATDYYHAVWQRDRTQVSAAFSLARLRLAEYDRAGAVAVLDQVPAVSLHYYAARIATVRVFVGDLGEGPPTSTDLVNAFLRRPELNLEGDEENGGAGPARDRLDTEVYEAALHRAVKSGDGERRNAVGAQLEQCLRGLARQARDAESQGVLIDLANTVRPKTWF